MINLEYKWLGQDVDFEHALTLQEKRVQEIISERDQAGTFYFLEHQPVYTAGIRNASIPEALPHPTVKINRGGLATYHGPGQLVGYLVTDLVALGKDLHTFLRTMEEALIRACKKIGINAGREDGLTGVWTQKRKVASMGIGVRKWVSMHGFALNVSLTSLPPFDFINPCGIDGVTMTCLHNEGSWTGSPEDLSLLVFQEILDLINSTPS